MPTRVVAIEYQRAMHNGRTRPCLFTCEPPHGGAMDVVVKFSGGCDRGVTALAVELLCSLLASDLGLNVPDPVLVEVPPELAHMLPDDQLRTMIQTSSPVAFGTRFLAGGYGVWPIDRVIPEALLPLAYATMAFDGFCQNPDRRSENPNCLARGDDIQLIDHELCFSHSLILGWRAPWLAGGLNDLANSGAHIFYNALKRKRNSLDDGAIRIAWNSLSDAGIDAYTHAMPPEWGAAAQGLGSATRLIRDVRDNIDACLLELRRILE